MCNVSTCMLSTREIYASQGLLAPLKKSPRQKEGVGEGQMVLVECGPHPLSSGSQEGFPVLESESRQSP